MDSPGFLSNLLYKRHVPESGNIPGFIPLIICIEIQLEYMQSPISQLSIFRFGRILGENVKEDIGES